MKIVSKFQVLHFKVRSVLLGYLLYTLSGRQPSVYDFTHSRLIILNKLIFGLRFPKVQASTNDHLFNQQIESGVIMERCSKDQ